MITMKHLAAIRQSYIIEFMVRLGILKYLLHLSQIYHCWHCRRQCNLKLLFSYPKCPPNRKGAQVKSKTG